MTDAPIITTSERRAFKRCPQRWQWEYRDGLRANVMNDKLWFGIGVHMALAHYYGNEGTKRNLDFIDVWDQFCDNDEVSLAIRTRPNGEWDDDPKWVEARTLGRTMLQGYHEWYGGDPTWHVVYVEKPFEIGIPDPRHPEDDVAVFTSTFDGVYYDLEEKRFKLMEHKTEAAAAERGYLRMDDQGGSYWAVASLLLRHEGILKPNQSISGIEYNFLRKALPDDRPRDAEGYYHNKPRKEHYQAALEHLPEYNPKATLAVHAALADRLGIMVLGDRSMQQPPPLFSRETVRRTRGERRTQIDRIAQEAMAMERFRTGEQVPYKNPTRDCSWDCPFYNMCELHEEGGADWQEFRDAVFTRLDPYDRYRMLKSA